MKADWIERYPGHVYDREWKIEGLVESRFRLYRVVDEWNLKTRNLWPTDNPPSEQINWGSTIANRTVKIDPETPPFDWADRIIATYAMENL